MRNKRKSQRNVAESKSRIRGKIEKNIAGKRDLKKRTKEYALGIIEFVDTLPRGGHPTS